jgi:hypothetical protein
VSPFLPPVPWCGAKNWLEAAGEPGQCARVGAVCVNGSVQFSFVAVPPRSLHHRLDGRLRSPRSTQVLSTRSLGLLNFASDVVRSVSPSTQCDRRNRTGQERGGIGLRPYDVQLYDAEVPPLGARIVGYENQTDASSSHATIGSEFRPCGLCRHTHGRGRMQALLRPRGLCRGPTRTRAWHRPQLSTVKRTHNIPGIGARLNPERGMVMDATGPVGGEERTACALSPACCRSDACEMSACLLIGERNGRRRRSRIASRCCCCRFQRGQCSSR